MNGHGIARASPAAVLLALAACHHGGAARLEGRWRGVHVEGVGREALAAANGFATETEIDVKSDVLSVTTPKGRQSGRYKVVREDEHTVVITTDKDGPSDPQTFTFVDDRTMKWAVLEGKSIVFQKQ
jgi:hypothetical protein